MKLQLAAKYSFDFLHSENIFHRRNCNGIWKETEEMAKGKTENRVARIFRITQTRLSAPDIEATHRQEENVIVLICQLFAPHPNTVVDMWALLGNGFLVSTQIDLTYQHLRPEQIVSSDQESSIVKKEDELELTDYLPPAPPSPTHRRAGDSIYLQYNGEKSEKSLGTLCLSSWNYEPDHISPIRSIA